MDSVHYNSVMLFIVKAPQSNYVKLFWNILSKFSNFSKQIWIQLLITLARVFLFNVYDVAFTFMFSAFNEELA